MSIIRDERVIVKANRALNSYYFLLSFDSPYLASVVKPGQFLQLGFDRSTCFLRRPFSVYDIEQQEIFILYMSVGRGTQMMTTLKQGDVLDVLGPLGNGFSLPERIKNFYLLAGGTGIGSVYLLFKELKRQRQEVRRLIVGFRRGEYVFDSLRDDPEITIFTEDGSIGRKGRVPDVLKEFQGASVESAIYVCGPYGMLQAVYTELEGSDSWVEVSLEEAMACGVGACLGCVAETPTGRLSVCRSGPIFELKNIVTYLAGQP